MFPGRERGGERLTADGEQEWTWLEQTKMATFSSEYTAGPHTTTTPDVKQTEVFTFSSFSIRSYPERLRVSTGTFPPPEATGVKSLAQEHNVIFYTARIEPSTF